MYSDIPNLQHVKIPASFGYTQSQSISSIDCLIDLISFIDVSSILADHVQIVSDSTYIDSDSDSYSDSDSDSDSYSDSYSYSYSDTYSGSE